MHKIPFSDIIHALEYDEDKQQVILGSERGSCPALLYVINAKKELLTMAEYPKPCDSFRKLKRLASGNVLAVHANGKVVSWNFTDEKKPTQEEIFGGIVPAKQIWEPKLDFAGDVSADEKKLFLGIFNGQVFLVDLLSKKVRELTKISKGARLRAARFFPDNKTVVISRCFAHGPMPIEIWDTDLNLMIAHTNGLGNALDVNKDGTLIAIENSLWDVSFLKHLRTLSLKKVVHILGIIKEKRKQRGLFFTNDDKFDIIAACMAP